MNGIELLHISLNLKLHKSFQCFLTAKKSTTWRVKASEIAEHVLQHD